jgi:hypothetical protein
VERRVCVLGIQAAASMMDEFLDDQGCGEGKGADNVSGTE